MNIHPVLDDGATYPHHNLYYNVSDTWDLRVLGGLLLSRVAQAFIEAYAVRMRGGTLRFQAQYLRRIRVPQPSDLSPEDRDGLATAFEERDVAAATRSRCACTAWRNSPMTSIFEDQIQVGLNDWLAIRHAHTAKQLASGKVDVGTRGAVTGQCHLT
ncbi:MAG: hypothetical protein ACRDNW_19415 [Trebonia sp.]